MAAVQLIDVIIPDVYETYTAVNSPETSAFVESGIAFRNPFLDTVFDGGGTTFYVPFWNDLDQTVEPNYSSDSTTVQAVPQLITAGEMQGRAAWMNQAYSAMDLVSEIAGADPMQQVRNRFGTYWQRQLERRILATCLGLLNSNVAGGAGVDATGSAGDMVINMSVTAKANVTAANLWGQPVFSLALFTLGDQFGGITAIAVHSVIAKRMYDANALTMVPNDPLKPISDLNPTVPYYMGRRVIVDDLMPVVPVNDTFQYTTIMFGANCIGYGNGKPRVPVELWRSPQLGNGGGLEQLWERKTWAIHPYGYKFNNAVVSAQSPTFADLKQATNWSRVIPRKLVPISFVVTNG